MSLRNYSNLDDLIYNYLSYKEINKSPEIDLLINECLNEVKELSIFKYIYIEYDYIIDVLNKEPYLSYLNNSKYLIIATTLGTLIDQRIKYYSKINLSKMLVFDACASAYLEYMADKYEDNLNLDFDYRFCPGYGGSNILDNLELYKMLNAGKIGIEILPSALMIPQKSMIGIVRIGNKNKRNCSDCINYSDCIYRKEMRTCFN